MLEESKMGFFRRLAVFETDVGGCVVDPLNVDLGFFGPIRDEVVVSKRDDISRVEIIDTSDMNFVPLRLKTRVLGINGGYQVRLCFSCLCACWYK